MWLDKIGHVDRVQHRLGAPVNMYTYSHSTTYFLVTNIFIHIQNIYLFTFQVKRLICQSGQVKRTP